MPITKTTMSGALSDYLDASKQKSPIVKPVSKWLMIRELPPSTRSIVQLHPSEVVADNWCPRYAQLVIEGDIEPAKKRPPFQLETIFAEGHAIHAKWQQWLGDMGVLYGLWGCLACSELGWALGLPDDLCGHPRACKIYREVPLETELWQSHADGIVVLEEGDAPKMIEIKSIGKGTIRHATPSLLKEYPDLTDAFKKIAQPFTAHTKQIQIYMYLANLLDDQLADSPVPHIDSAVMIYENKADQAVKEFNVPFDPEQIADILEYSEDIARHLGTGTTVPCNYTGRGVCPCQ